MLFTNSWSSYRYKYQVTLSCIASSLHGVLHVDVQKNWIPNEIRERLVRSYADYLMVADTLGVKTWGILTRYICEGWVQERLWGGRNNMKVDDDIKQCLNDKGDDYCMLTPIEIKRELRRRLPRSSNTSNTWPHGRKDTSVMVCW